MFNQVSRIAIFPLVSVTTSFVAEEDAMSNGRDKDKINQENKHAVSDAWANDQSILFLTP